MFVCHVILDLPLRQNYSYRYQSYLAQGTRVTVEFRNRQYIGFVIASVSAHQFNDYPLEKLSNILNVSDEHLSLSTEYLEIANFVSKYYHHPLGSTVFCTLPSLLKKLGEPELSLKHKQYYTATSTELNSKSVELNQLYQHLVDKQLNEEQIRQIITKNPNSTLKKWLNKSLIQSVNGPKPETTANEIALNHEQQAILDNFLPFMGQFHAGLLYGITGSGKTEVFLQLIKHFIAHDKQILVLVPEINLTPQLLSRFKKRFPYADINILNSEIGSKERFTNWQSCANGSCNILIGTRLSIFTPFNNLGLIIVDEEHDESFKQNDGLRYHARDIAVWRAKHRKIPILLASATPSLESLYNYKLGKYTLYKLSQRAVNSAQLPEIQLINLQHTPVNYAGISQAAIEALDACLAKQEIALVFINRRGYAPIITCYDCGWVSECQYCSTKMVYHHNKQQLKCHHCGYQISVPPKCPKCSNQYLHTIGHGTQKLEEFLNQNYPNAKIIRVDRDTTTTKRDWDTIYSKVHQSEVDILVGTQMLAKGHDFANLTLVIGLNLDNALFSYDFRASEDMFNIVTQVAGRAGRADKKGLVLLQTNYPNHPVYQFLKEHDFNGFINHTLRERKNNNLPPFSFYTLIKLSTINEDHLKTSLAEIHKLAKTVTHDNTIMIYAPVPAVMYKLHNRYRGQMLIAANNRNQLHTYLAQLEHEFSKIKNVTIAIDVDPFEV